ncbi:hypothetical protein [Halomonas llamarensis]|uniref:Transporter n=1 Tax=Halomonas llamarensis TaxID=2945104 RepID=A0ABT0SSS9_9GAMM|nr:hypothetical protein [Halomonas llamarensis]MCL7930882.1 hypothetical protein [Halomonas llamarensis]
MEAVLLRDNILRVGLVSFLTMVSSVAAADLPLTVEELITDKGKFKIDASLSYANNERQGVMAGEPVTIQTGETSFITLPTQFGESKQNIDVLVGTLGFRYGVSNEAEVYARSSYLYKSVRSGGLSEVEKNNENRLVDSWLGLNYQFSQDNDTPAFLGFVEGALYEKHQQSHSSGKSWKVGATIYRAIDPVVLSLTSSVQWNQERDDGGINFQPGNHASLRPSVAFAVNDRVTLTTGFQWMSRQADRYNNQPQGFRQTSTDVTLGLGYGVSKGNTLNLTFQANASGRGGSDLRLNWLYAF